MKTKQVGNKNSAGDAGEAVIRIYEGLGGGTRPPLADGASVGASVGVMLGLPRLGLQQGCLRANSINFGTRRESAEGTKVA
jgi:hypothetical protein